MNPNPSAPAFCEQCGSPLAPGELQCHGCRWLVHSERLKTLAAQAQDAQARGELSVALSHWRDALALLPPDTQQYSVILGQIRSLSDRITAGTSSPKDNSGKSAAGGLGAIGLLLWKFKTAILIALTKGKFILFGLSKMSTFISMLISFGFYTTFYGWQFAAGLVLSIFVHEMGHVYELNRYGVKASAPMFIPGFGALIAMRGVGLSPREDARIGLAGPLWGFGAALAALLLGYLTGIPVMLPIAKFTAVMNLFNLIPIWQLDGSHAFRALSTQQRWLIAGACLLLWIMTHEGFLIGIGLVGAFRAWREPGSAEPDGYSFSQFLFLLAALSFLSLTPLPALPNR